MLFIFELLSQGMVFVDEHLELLLYLIVILVDVVVIGELLDRFSKLSVDLDKFF